jgi:hypothetical protein
MAPPLFGREPTYPGSNYEPTIFDRAWHNRSDMFNGWRRNRQFKALEVGVGELCAAAEAYQSQGIAPGNERYIRLLERANQKINQFARDWGEEANAMTDSWPQYHVLVQLTDPKMATPSAQRSKLAIAGVIAVVIGTPLVAALMVDIFKWATHWVH